MRYLYKGLQSKAPSVLDIFATWNQEFYLECPEGVKNVTGSIEEDLDNMIDNLHMEGAQAQMEKEHNHTEEPAT